MRILDYRPNFGTLSSGLESIFKNEVTEAVKLNNYGVYGYNTIHKQWFSSSLSNISTFEPEKKVDLAIFRPEYGENVSRRGEKNFFFYDFQACLDFLDNNRPKFAIFQTETSVIPHVSTAVDYVRDGFGQLSKDRIIYSLQQMGYDAYLVVIDEADYGIPLHRSFAFYVATPEGFGFRMPRPRYTASGRGKYEKYRTVANAIGDLEAMGDWVEYGCRPQNSYQEFLRSSDVGRVTWHHPPKIRKGTEEKIAKIKQGSNNSTVVAKGRSKGYNRAKWNDICRAMDSQFYLVSSKLGDSIHPIKNRPFSIREGCRIHGLPDRLSFDLKTPRKEIAYMIHHSVSPAIGQLFGFALRCELD